MKLNQDNETYIKVFYNNLKKNIKDEIIKINKRLKKLSKIIKKAI